METPDKLIIPDDIVDPTQYRIYCALKNHPILRDTIYVASDGTEINIGCMPNLLKKRIEHLSPAEQEEILEKKRQYNQIRMKVALAMGRAKGQVGRNGGKTHEEMQAALKVSPFEQDVIELLGRMFTTQEVVKIMIQDNKVECTEQEVKDILRNHIAEIEKKRDEFRERVADVRLYNKRPRLEELAWMYSKMKQKFIVLNNTDTYNAMLRTLEQIRKEAEGDTININSALDINIELTIQTQLQREALKTINLKEIILGRVAARMNYDPLKLLAGLHNSQYAKFVHIGGDFDANAEMKYPSQSPYDFAKIEREAEDVEAVDVSPEEPTQEEKQSANDIKQMFLNKIRKQREEMERRQTIYGMQQPIPEVEEEKPIKRGNGRGKDKELISKQKKHLKKNQTLRNAKEYKPKKEE